MKDGSFTACQSDTRRIEPTLGLAQQADFRANFVVMLAAVVAGIGLMGLKFCGYWITGSSAILSDALESIINVVASGFGLVSVGFLQNLPTKAILTDMARLNSFPQDLREPSYSLPLRASFLRE